MAQQISPFFRSPWTDLTGGLVSHQLCGRCASREMDMMDCLEAYGLDRGMRKCKDLIEEFRECHMLTKQFKRFNQLSPLFRSPWTDLTGGLVSHQLCGRCASREMDMMDCLEAYGLDRGMRKCKDLVEEFRECHMLTKQFKRFYAMRTEREKQIAEGKLKGQCRYVTPKVDSY